MWVYFDSYLQLLHLHFLYLNTLFPLFSVKSSLIFKFYCQFKRQCLRKKCLSFGTFLSWQILIILFEWLAVMAIPVVEFSRQGYKISKYYWLRINCSPMKSLNFVDWCNGEVSKSAQFWLSKSIFYVKNHLYLSESIFIEEFQNRSTFFVIDTFDSLPLYSNSQNSMISFDYNWFLAKNLSNLVSFPWKLHNRYCHTTSSSLKI